MSIEAPPNAKFRCMPARGVEGLSTDVLLSREWLVTNGLGGYSSNTVCGVSTRSYHGLLIASLPAPLGRMMLLSAVSEQVRLSNGQTVRLGGAEYVGGRVELDYSSLIDFCLDAGLPVWRYEVGESI